MNNEEKSWQKYIGAGIILLVLYFVIKSIIDPTPCYPGEYVEWNDGRSSGICHTSVEEHDEWARRHMSYEEYKQWQIDSRNL